MAQRIVRLYWIMTFLEVFFIGLHCSIYSLYLEAGGLNYTQRNIVNMFFMFTIVLCEVPTGVVADLMGRKFSWVLSLVMTGLGMIAYGFAHSFWGFVTAEVISAIGMTFASGAFEAWVRDEVAASGGDISDTIIFGHSEFGRDMGHAISALLGALLAEKLGMSAPWIIGGVGLWLLAGMSFALMSERGWAKSATHRSPSTLDVILHSRKGLRAIWQNSRLMWFFCALLFMSFSVQGLNMMWSPYFRDAVSLPTIGWIGSGMFVFKGAGSFLMSRLGNRFVTPMGMAMAFWITAVPLMIVVVVSPMVGIAPFMLHEVGRGLWEPINKVWVNGRIADNGIRATVLSWRSVVQHVGAGVGLLVSGMVADAWGIPAAWAVGAGVLILGSVTFRRLVVKE